MKAAIGIDIGGTNIQVGLTLELGEVLHQTSLRVVHYQQNQIFLNVLTDVVQEFTALSNDLEIIGIGIGSPGANILSGTIQNASNLPWDNLPIVGHLKTETALPVYLTNDANLFAIAEKVFGQAKEMQDFISLTLGTGVGAGIYTSGELLTGRDGLAGEVGHLVYNRGGRPCKCGRNGCLERYVSASGVVETTRQLIREARLESELIGIPESYITAEAVAEAAKNDDLLAIRVFEVTGQILGESLADLTATFNPETIFISGGLANANEVLFAPLRSSFEKSLLAIYPTEIPVLKSSIPDRNAGVLGASALVWEQSKIATESTLTAYD
ncbi:ROK family protein [Marinoscillum sp.]|uniref:ROK family protein n=1 Tax=Marinoscillum sp. TaxID=2024838 RepID=UPI003BA9B714